MSATSHTDVSRTVERCRPENVSPVRLDAAALESTAHDYLDEIRAELHAEGKTPARLVVEASFDADCSFATQEEADRVREYVYAASYLGASAVTVDVTAVADETKVRPALAACAERARREGVSLELDGNLSL